MRAIEGKKSLDGTEEKQGSVGAAGVGLSLPMAVLSGSTERWLVEDCGKSRFAGAQKALWKHKALPRSLIINGNRTPGVRGKNSWLSLG